MDPYNRIMRAAKRDRGVRLTADEVWALHLDDAIATRAAVIQDEPSQWDEQMTPGDGPPESDN